MDSEWAVIREELVPHCGSLPQADFPLPIQLDECIGDDAQSDTHS
jgi:hypothetical protein